MKNLLLSLAAIFVILIFAGCQSQLKTISENNSSLGDNSMTSLDWEGTYEGILPCADCEGIQTVIKLNKDLTYSIQSKYIGKDDKIFSSNGTFSWDESGNKIIFDNADTGVGAKFYQVGENKITQLDLAGNKISGSLADKYILRKTDNLISEKYWKLVELMGKEVKFVEGGKREAYMILKEKNNRVSGNGSCNTFNGSYELKEGNQISFSNMAVTLMSCENMEIEREFLKVLEMADSYYLISDTLILNRAKMAPLARFEAVYLR